MTYRTYLFQSPNKALILSVNYCYLKIWSKVYTHKFVYLCNNEFTVIKNQLLSKDAIKDQKH